MKHAFANAHHETVRRSDHLEFDLRLVDEKHFCAGEFAADELGALLGVRTSTAEAMATTADGLRQAHPRVWQMCGRGEVAVKTADALMQELGHLDVSDRDEVEELLLGTRSSPR